MLALIGIALVGYLTFTGMFHPKKILALTNKYEKAMLISFGIWGYLLVITFVFAAFYAISYSEAMLIGMMVSLWTLIASTLAMFVCIYLFDKKG